jgi:hypothetical protein
MKGTEFNVLNKEYLKQTLCLSVLLYIPKLLYFLVRNKTKTVQKSCL